MKQQGLSVLLKRQKDNGITCIVLGSPRSGKTTFLATVALRILETFPEEKIFWRGDTHCQWAYLPLDKIRLLLSPEFTYTFINLKDSQPVQIEKHVHSVEYCYNIREFYDKALPGLVNVFYMDPNLYVDFFKVLKERESAEWISMFVDEIQELYPENAKGRLWWICFEAGNIITHFPKRMVNFYCATQSYALVSYQIKHHMRYWVFMPRALKPKGLNLRIFQSVIDRLPMGHCIVEGLDGFREADFPKLKLNMDLICLQKPRFEFAKQLSRQEIEELKAWGAWLDDSEG